MDHLWIDLAAGGEVLQASDDYLNPAARLLETGEPVADPGRGTSHGAWLDGWETRRIRPPGHEWALVRLGVRGIVHGVVVDTTHVGLSLPAACSVEAIDLPGGPDLVELVRSRSKWREIVPRTGLGGAGRHGFVADPGPATHLRLVIYPDGGIARLRVMGEPLPPDELPGSGTVDLAATSNGGLVTDVSDRTSSPNRMLGPGDPADHTDGWITRRRRTPGHEWAVIRLGARGEIERIEIDSRKWPGDSPDEITVSGIDAAEGPRADDPRWAPLIGASFEAGSRLRTGDLEEPGPVTHLRLDLHPDGAVGRFRAFGEAFG